MVWTGPSQGEPSDDDSQISGGGGQSLPAPGQGLGVDYAAVYRESRAHVEWWVDAEALFSINSIAQFSRLDIEEYRIARLSALAAMDATEDSYRIEFDDLDDNELETVPERMRSILVAIAPIIGTPRIISASVEISRAIHTDATDTADATIVAPEQEE